jgi:hypothetical protein
MIIFTDNPEYFRFMKNLIGNNLRTLDRQRERQISRVVRRITVRNDFLETLCASSTQRISASSSDSAFCTS